MVWLRRLPFSDYALKIKMMITMTMLMVLMMLMLLMMMLMMPMEALQGYGSRTWLQSARSVRPYKAP